MIYQDIVIGNGTGSGFKSLSEIPYQVILGDVENVKKTCRNYYIFLTMSSVSKSLT